jgi:hypothetical protein
LHVDHQFTAYLLPTTDGPSRFRRSRGGSPAPRQERNRFRAELLETQIGLKLASAGFFFALQILDYQALFRKQENWLMI